MIKLITTQSGFAFACRHSVPLYLTLSVFFAVAALPAFSADTGTVNRVRAATVKISNTSIRPSYYLPWRMKGEEGDTGSGVIIDGNLILTNAHVVSDSTYIEVQKENDPNRYRAEVKFIGHQCDLALLSVSDARFFDNTKPMSVGKSIPELESAVTTFGYPTGGDRISVTEGVISRIELSQYSHSLQSTLLVLQTDAAINPGNSGGPVVQNGTLVGLAFQVLGSAENIGYIIPAPVIRHFLDDVADGTFSGFPSLGVFWEKLESDNYRLYLGMDPKQSGILITRVLEEGSSYTYLMPGDVVTKAGGIPIANDGTIPFNDGRLSFSYVITSRQVGEKVDLEVFRNKKLMTVNLQLSKKEERIPSYNEYETLPRYYIYGGIIFQPLDREFLKSWDNFWYNADMNLLYDYYYYETDAITPEREEFIIINHILPDSANTYISDISFSVVDSINGKKINKLEDVIEALKHPANNFQVIKLDGNAVPIVLKAADADAAGKRILARYGIRSESRLNKNTGYAK
jgi:S1-C subfamily serine protease